MRSLTEEETRACFEKLANYTGSALKNLIAPLDDSPDADRFVFRLHRDRVYYVKLSIANLATSIARDKLISLGTCLGKFTKTKKFRLHITALSVIAPIARGKVWIKPNGVGPFTYGGSIVKAHVGRWSDEIPEHQGVVVFDMNDLPLGFGVSAVSSTTAKNLDPTAIVVHSQADVGLYLRSEQELFA